MYVLGLLVRLTIRQLLHEKAFTLVFLFAFGFLGISFFTSYLTFVHQERVLIDFGLGAIELGTLVLALLFGASLIPKEIEQHTCNWFLMRPVWWGNFILGKTLGLCVFLWAQIGILGIVLACLVWIQGGFFVGSSFWLALVWIMILSMFWVNFSVFFSLWMRPFLAGVLTFSIYFLGMQKSQMLWLLQKDLDVWTQSFLKLLSAVVPDFEKFHLGTKVVYQWFPGWNFIFASIGYAGVWIGLLLVGSLWCFQRKDF